MKRILITGGAGYIGSLLSTSLINEGHKVTVVDLLKYNKSSIGHLFFHKNFKFIKEDCRKKNIIKKLIKENEILIPLAGLVGAPLCEKFEKDAISTNFEAIKMLKDLADTKKKIIYMTSNSGYGIGQKGKYCDENSPLNPISLYGITKCDAEKEVLKFKNSICFRLATVFGCSYRMRSDVLVNNFVYRAVNEKKLDIFEPEFRRNFIHVRDVVRCISFSINNFNKLKGEVYNLGLSSANISKIQLAKKIKKNLPETKIKIIKNQSDPDKRDYFVSNRKIEKQGFIAKINLDTGIRELAQYFKNNDDKILNNY